tara:strand:- start:5940 stop:6206 length:267 start_codon:yes stop_codon:yes gene_type:complete
MYLSGMENATTNYNELMKASYDGSFTVYVNNNISVYVCAYKETVTITTDKTNPFLLDDVKTHFFTGGGMFGKPTTEQGYNEIMKTLTK